MGTVLLCLATEKGRDVLCAVAAERGLVPTVVCTFREVAVAESFHESIIETASAAGIPVIQWADFQRIRSVC